MNWYIVQAYSGFEKKVVDSIKDVLAKNKLESHMEKILVPTHQVTCLLYTSPSPRDRTRSRMPSSA